MKKQTKGSIARRKDRQMKVQERTDNKKNRQNKYKQRGKDRQNEIQTERWKNRQKKGQKCPVTELKLCCYKKGRLTDKSKYKQREEQTE